MTHSYIATFYTHFAAMRSYKALREAGVDCAMAPVPRFLSASCGTCLRYMAEEPHSAAMHSDMEQLVELYKDGGYAVLKENR